MDDSQYSHTVFNKFLSLLRSFSVPLFFVLVTTQSHALTNGVTLSGADSSAKPTHPSSIVFIDAGVQEIPVLLSGLSADVEAIILRNDTDGVQQITEALKDYRHLDSIQIISHGAPGQLMLGSTPLTDANLDHYRSALNAWGATLKTSGGILLYGCDVAQGVDGERFVERLDRFTGAAVAASKDETGPDALGGNWLLEKQTGVISAAMAISDAVMSKYRHLLALPSNGVQDITDSMANGTPTLVSFLNGFTFTNNSGYNITGDSTVGANGFYFSETTAGASSTFTVNADVTNLGSFDLTAMSFTEFSDMRNYDFTITGYKLAGGTVTTTFTATGNSFTSGNYTNFTAITGFRVTYVSTNSGPPENITFDSFTIANATSSAPTVTAISPSGGPIAGGTSVTITGTNFTGATSVTIGGAAATGVSVVNATTITATTPAGTAGARDVAVTTPDGTGTGTGLFTYYATPTVTAISPTSGPEAGGTSVTITGTNFTGATAVTIGGASATGVSVVNSTTITATTPAGTAGARDVAVTTPGGTGTGSGLFTYIAAPTVTGISPTAGPTVGGTSVTITGTNLTGATSVTIGGAAATGVSVVNSTTITATTPAGTAGARDVAVTTPGGTGTGTGLFTYYATPTVTAISPTGGPTAGGTSVTITGTNFTGATSVTIGGTSATGVSVVNSTTITATTPAGTVGARDVAVTTPGGTGTGTGLFTYYATPTVTAISPTSGPAAGGTSVTITGTNFTGATSVTIGGAAATGVSVVNSTTITATTPAGTAGARDVAVTTPGGTGTGSSLFTYYAVPTVTAIGPTSGPAAGGTSVTITGTNFTGATSVAIGGASATGVSVVNSTTITATTPAGTAGARDVAVTTPGGTGTGTGLFTYYATPTVTAISPTSGPAAGGTSVTITGTNFTGATSVTIGGAAATAVSVVNSTTITANTPAGSAGARDVAVTTPGGTGTGAGLFTYVAAPTVTGISPSYGVTTGGTSVTITGTNFTGTTSVTIGGAAATGVSVVNSTTITATTPTGTAGARDVAVTTPGGTGTGTGLFTYIAAPTVTAISPTGGPIAGGTSVTITGTSFTGATSVTIGGAAATGVSVVNDTTITATTPAGTAGARDVVVTNSVGSGTGTGLFTYVAAPTVTAISPTSGPEAGGTSVTITGTNLTGATSVTVGGAAATGISVVNSTTITANTPAGAAGARDVAVTTMGGTGTGTGLFTYIAAPTVTGISPTSGLISGGTSVTITGTNFTGTTSVTIGGTSATGVSVVNATTITATTPAGTTGAKDVVVTTPGGSGTGIGMFTYANVPGAPTGVTASAGNTQATVNFSAPGSDGGSAIITYTATSSPGGLTGSCSGPAACAITVSGLSNGTAYTFTVTATNAIGTGTASTASNSVTPSATVPGAPTSVSATAGDTQATVNFTAPASDGGSAITTYTATSSPGSFTGSCAGPAACAITVTSLTNGVAYTFTVTATNAIGTGVASTASSSVTPTAAPTVPGAPTGVTATAGNAQATVNFTAPASDGGSAITTYTATSSPGGLTGNCSGPAACAITVTGLTNSTAYTFTVTATNAIGTSSASTASTAVTPAAAVPDAPSAVTATAGYLQATVNFTAPASDGGSAITSYTATSSPDGMTGSCTGPAACAITVAGLTGGMAYTFTVTATNAVGTSAASVASNSVTVSATRPDPTEDPDVIGVVDSQVETANRFWRTQISNYHQRLELLHHPVRQNASAPDTLAAKSNSMAMTTDSESFVGASLAQNRIGRSRSLQSNEPIPVVTTDTERLTVAMVTELASILTNSSLNFNLAALDDGGVPTASDSGEYDVWIAGNVRIGTSKTEDGSATIDYTTDGITLGADRRYSENLMLGMGIGYAHDESTVGSDGTGSLSNGSSIAIYASYQPGTSMFIDGLFGYGALSMDSSRYVAAVSSLAKADRSGSQAFGSLAVGYEYHDEATLMSPYARYDIAIDWLDSATETGAGSSSLNYSSQKYTSQQVSLGLRAEFQHKDDFYMMQPRARVEYQHHINGGSDVSIAYADMISSRYSLAVPTVNADSILIGVGSSFVLRSGLNLDLDYQWVHSTEQDESQAIFVRISKMFD